MKYIASVSFGKDSLAMLLRLLEEHYPLDAVVFYDTGMEFKAIYHIRDRVKRLLHENGIEFVELHPSEPFLYSMLERKIKYRNKEGYHYGFGWCGGPCRWGTSKKTNAIQKYKKSVHDIVTDYVGIAADEPQRFEKSKSEGKRLPLVNWGMSEDDCLSYCHERGWYWHESVLDGVVELYSILDRVSCWCCSNKNLKELRNMYWQLPEYWDQLKDLQLNIDRPFKGFYKGTPKGVFELEERFKNEKEDQVIGGENK